VIAKVVRGYRAAGLLAYLFGPGKYETHHNPRVVASWDGAPWLHQPAKLPGVVLDGEVVPAGEFDLDLRPLTQTMQELADAAGLPVSNPPRITPQWAGHLERGGRLPTDAPGWVRHYKYDPQAQAVVLRPGYVWHCPVRLHPDDPTLTDQQWQTIAERLMRATGIHQAGCRWIAVRHADDHIHLMASLISETTGKRFHPYRDYFQLREECRAIERDLGLVETAPADKTALTAPTRAEKGKAERHGRSITAREELRRAVAQCAAATQDPAGFLAELRREGLDPRTTLDAEGQVCGYSVARPGDLTAAGGPVRFSGSTLATDLSWPTLLNRWASTPPQVVPLPRTADDRVPMTERHAALTTTADTVDQAVAAVRERSEDVDALAHATGEILTVLARGREDRGPGPFARTAERYDRAARTPHQVLPRSVGPVARELRRASRHIAAAGALTGRGNEKFAMTALLLALAGLVAEIAAWQQQRGRHHQAAAAQAARDPLMALTGGNRSRPAGHPAPPSREPRWDRPRPRHEPPETPLDRPQRRGSG